MDRSFKIAGREIFIENWMDEFNSIYKAFHEQSFEMVEKFMNTISDESLDSIMANLKDITAEIVCSFVDMAIEYLTKLGIWNISREQFIEEYCDDYFPFMKLYNAYAAEYNKILDKAEQQKLYREYQRSSRSRWSGGGFGLSGAVRGAINAGILNAVTGTFRFIGDSVVNVMDSYNVSVDKERLHNSDFFESYATDLQYMCDCIGMSLYLKLHRLGKVEGINFNSGEVEAIISNLENHSTTREKQLNMLVGCIKKDPYNFNIYRHLFSILGASNIEVAQIAHYFGFKYELQVYFDGFLTENLQNVRNLPEETPTQCNQKRDKILMLLKTYNILNSDSKCNKEVVDAFNIKELHNNIVDTINELRKKTFNVDGKSFENVEGAQAYYEQKERERKAIEAYRAAQIRREENILTTVKVVVIIAIIGFVIFLGVKLIPKAFNFALDMVTPASTSIDRTKALNESESKYFENSSVLNYHRWFGGKLIKNDVNTPNNGRTYQRYIYSYENEKYPKQYMDMLVNDGFTKVSTETPQNEEKITLTRYKKMNPKNNEKTLEVQVGIYHDRDTVSILFSID